MQINKHHGEYNISKRTGAVKYIVCHYTGSGTSKAGNAKNNCIYFGGGNRGASAHYFIDDGGIWEYADPAKYYTWHCGDGHGKYGITNANSIGIEVCMDGDNPYTEKEIGYLGELVRHLMDEFDVPASRIVRHYDASRKMCPLYYAKRQDEWSKLHKRIRQEEAVAGWKKNSKGWWYQRKDGTYPKDGWEQIGGYWFLFDSKGYMLTGWQKRGSNWYYLKPNAPHSGRMLTGWLKDDGSWYYLKPDEPHSGRMYRDCFAQIDGKWYGFPHNGRMLTSPDQLTFNSNGSINLG